MTQYRRDENGVVYAWGGLIGNRTIDNRLSDREDFDKMMERRAGEVPHRRLTPMQRLAIDEEVWGFDSMVRRRAGELRSSGRRAVAGSLMCSACDTLNRADSQFCSNCGNALAPLESYQGVMSDDTVKCARCSRMNASSNKFCFGCGRPLSASASASSRPRRRLMSHSGGPAPLPLGNPLPPDGVHRRKGTLIALEDFSYVDSTTHKRVHIKSGRTIVSSDCEAVKVRPRAFAYAA